VVDKRRNHTGIRSYRRRHLAALNYANELIETEEFHPLPRVSGEGNALLVDGDLPRSTKILLKQYKHEAVDVRDINLRGAKDTKLQVMPVPTALHING